MTREDVAMLVEWGVDYLKYDNCFPRMVFKYSNLKILFKFYRKYGNSFPRMVFQYPFLMYWIKLLREFDNCFPDI